MGFLFRLLTISKLTIKKLVFPFLIIDKIIGKRSSDDLYDNQLFVEKMAELLVAKHKLNLPSIQQLDCLCKRHDNEKQCLQDLVFFIKNRCINFLGFSPLCQRRFILAVKRIGEAKLEKVRPALLHMDFEANHIIITEKGFSVFDWWDSAIGDPACDVARTYHLTKLGEQISDVDLGEYFVKSYGKYYGKNLPNLQFWKDMFAIRIAIRYGLSPFDRSKLLAYGLVVDLTFGFLYGKIQETRKLRSLKAVHTNHHTLVYSNFQYMQNYALNYLESGGYKQNGS
jgi:hypothetical protein